MDHSDRKKTRFHSFVEQGVAAFATRCKLISHARGLYIVDTYYFKSKTSLFVSSADLSRMRMLSVSKNKKIFA